MGTILVERRDWRLETGEKAELEYRPIQIISEPLEPVSIDSILWTLDEVDVSSDSPAFDAGLIFIDGPCIQVHHLSATRVHRLFR